MIAKQKKKTMSWELNLIIAGHNPACAIMKFWGQLHPPITPWFVLSEGILKTV